MNFIRNTPSVPRRRVLGIIAATLVSGALGAATRAQDAVARPDCDEDGPQDGGSTDTDDDHRPD